MWDNNFPVLHIGFVIPGIYFYMKNIGFNIPDSKIPISDKNFPIPGKSISRIKPIAGAVDYFALSGRYSYMVSVSRAAGPG